MELFLVEYVYTHSEVRLAFRSGITLFNSSEAWDTNWFQADSELVTTLAANLEVDATEAAVFLVLSLAILLSAISDASKSTLCDLVTTLRIRVTSWFFWTAI